MATPASRMMLSRSTKSLPLHLLRARLSGASTAINIPAFMSCAEVQHQGSNLVKYLLGNQFTAAPCVNNVGLILGQRFGEMALVEARGKKAVDDDDDEDYDDSDDDHFDEAADGSDFDDEDEDDDDSDDADSDDEDEDDGRKK